MREILFRGKRINNGEWVFGDLLNVGVDYDYAIRTYGGKEHGQVNAVNETTVGQFTGLTDKNGKKIFEGDIIRFHKYRYEPDWVGVVEYENCLYVAKGTMPLAYEKRIGEDAYYCPFEVQLSGIDKDRIVVIGNITDNRELLEVNN